MKQHPRKGSTKGYNGRHMALEKAETPSHGYNGRHRGSKTLGKAHTIQRKGYNGRQSGEKTGGKAAAPSTK